MGAAAAAATSMGGAQGDTVAKKPAKNVLGLDFEIPEELSQLLAQEMGKSEP